MHKYNFSLQYSAIIKRQIIYRIVWKFFSVILFIFNFSPSLSSLFLSHENLPFLPSSGTWEGEIGKNVFLFSFSFFSLTHMFSISPDSKVVTQFFGNNTRSRVKRIVHLHIIENRFQRKMILRKRKKWSFDKVWLGCF